MFRLLLAALLTSGLVPAQSVEGATELLGRVRSFAENTKNWRAEVVERNQISGGGTNLQNEIRTKIAVQAPLQMSRQNSGADQTIMVCDGTETFYSGDGHSYYRGEANVTPQCDLPLSRFYELESSPAKASVVGRDRIRFVDGDRECVLVRTASKHGSISAVRTMCIEPASASILRDVVENPPVTRVPMPSAAS
jgi:hypothetical protein